MKKIIQLIYLLYLTFCSLGTINANDWKLENYSIYLLLLNLLTFLNLPILLILFKKFKEDKQKVFNYFILLIVPLINTTLMKYLSEVINYNIYVVTFLLFTQLFLIYKNKLNSRNLYFIIFINLMCVIYMKINYYKTFNDCLSYNNKNDLIMCIKPFSSISSDLNIRYILLTEKHIKLINENKKYKEILEYEISKSNNKKCKFNEKLDLLNQEIKNQEFDNGCKLFIKNNL